MPKKNKLFCYKFGYYFAGILKWMGKKDTKWCWWTNREKRIDEFVDCFLKDAKEELLEQKGWPKSRTLIGRVNRQGVDSCTKLQQNLTTLIQNTEQPSN